MVDTPGLLSVFVVTVADTSDNAGGIAIVDLARWKCKRLKKISHDSGFEKNIHLALREILV